MARHLGFERNRLRPQIRGLVHHHRTCLKRDERADILAPERKHEGHGIQHPQRHIVCLRRHQGINGDGRRLNEGHPHRAKHNRKQCNDHAVNCVFTCFCLKQARVAGEVLSVFRHR